MKNNQQSQRTLIKKIGYEGYRKHMATIGAKGGKAKVPKGLSFTHNQMNRRKASEAV